MNDLGEVLCLAILPVYIIKSRNLNEPSHVMGVKLVIYNPFSEFCPFILGTPINANPPLNVLMNDD